MTGQPASAALLLALMMPSSDTPSQAEFVRSVGDDDSVIFLQIEGIAAWEDGRCVVSDRLAGTVTLLDGSGAVLAETVTGEAGAAVSGGPASLDCHGQFVAVADFASTRVQVFSAELIPLTTFQSEGPVIDLKFAPDGTLWLSAQTHRAKELLRYDRAGNLLARVLPAHLTGETFSDLFLCTVDHAGTVYLVYCVRNIIEMRQASGNLLRTLSVPDLPEEPPMRTLRRGLFRQTLHLPDGPLFRSAGSDSQGNLLILGGDYGPHPGRDLYILSPEGRCRTLVLPHRASRIWTNGTGGLLAVDDSKSRIDVYRFHETAGTP